MNNPVTKISNVFEQLSKEVVVKVPELVSVIEGVNPMTISDPKINEIVNGLPPEQFTILQEMFMKSLEDIMPFVPELKVKESSKGFYLGGDDDTDENLFVFFPDQERAVEALKQFKEAMEMFITFVK